MPLRFVSSQRLGSCIGCAFVCALVLGCRPREEGTPPATSVHGTSVPQLPAAVPEPSAEPKRHGAGRNRLTPVYIDGAPAGALAHEELPPSLVPTMVMRGEPFPLFPVAAYVEALGVPLEELREIHLMGGNRPAIIAGKELARVRDKLCFAFSRANAGKPRMDWPDERVESGTKIDAIASVFIYRHKEPPRFDRAGRVFRYSDGKVVEGVPYGDGDASLHGTRIYVDGRFRVAPHRRSLPEEVFTGGLDDDRLSLPLLLLHLGVPADDALAIDFIGDDRTVGRLDREGWKQAGATMGVWLRRGGGGLTADVPAQASPEPGLALLSALAVYVTTKPPARTVRAPRHRPDR